MKEKELHYTKEKRRKGYIKGEVGNRAARQGRTGREGGARRAFNSEGKEGEGSVEGRGEEKEINI